MGDFQMEECIRASNVGEVVDFAREIAEIEGGELDRIVVEAWFSKSDRFLAAIWQGKVVGAVSFSTKGIENIRTPVLDFVNVLRPFQRKGVATRLCIAAIHDLVSDGFTPIHCTTLTPQSHRLVTGLPEESRLHLRIKKGF